MRNLSKLKQLFLYSIFFSLVAPFNVYAAWPSPDITSRVVKNNQAIRTPFAAPIAVEDEYSVMEGALLEVHGQGVLENDFDPDGESITAEYVTLPSHFSGTFELNPDGTLVYQHDGSEDSEDTFTYWVTDSVEYSAPVTVKIAILAVNDAPVLNEISSGSVSYTENNGAVVLFPNIIVSDNDNTHLASATIQIAAGLQTDDVLSYNALSTGISGSYNSGTGILLLTGSETIENYQAVLRTVSFANSGENPTNTTRTVTVYVSDGGSENPISNTLNKSVIVTPVNDPPVLANLETSDLTYTEGSGPVQLTGSITVNDADHLTLAYATVSISSNFQNTEDVLSFTNAYGLTGNWNSTSGMLTLTGNASPSDYQAALRTVRYENTSPAPLTSDRTVTFNVHDGTAASNALLRTIKITAQNALPVLNNIGPSVNFTEDGSSVQLTTTLTVEDNDSPNLQSASVSITGNFQMNEDVLTYTPTGGIAGVYNGTTGILSFTNPATLTSYRNILRSVRFSNTSQNPGNLSKTIAFAVHDGLDGSLPVYKTVTITPVNDPPVLAGIEGTALNYEEGDGAVQITGSLTVNDIDHTLLSYATVSISSNYQNTEDVLSFTNAYGLTGNWNSTSGMLTLTGSASPSDYQAALRTVRYENTSPAPLTSDRTVTFNVHDGTGASNAVLRTIKITAQNALPVLNNIGPTVNFTEDGASVQLTTTLTVEDNDSPNLQSASVSITGNFQMNEDVLTYAPTGGISGNYSNTTGILSFTGNATLNSYRTILRSVRFSNSSQNSVNNSRTIAFAVHDGLAGSLPVYKTVTITPVNDQPVLAGIEGTALAYEEGDGAVQITGNITVADIDNLTLPSAIVSIITNFQSDQDVLSYVNGNGLTGSWSSATGQLTLTGSATLAEMQTALRSVRYTNTSANPNTSTRTIRFVVNDGAGNSNTVNRSITIGSANTPPELTDPSTAPVSYTEGDAAVRLTNTIVVADEDNITLASATVSITSGFLNTEDVLSFTPVSGISGSYNSTTGILSLTGNSSLTNYQAILRSIRYQNTSEDPSIANRIVTFVVHDGTSPSELLTKTVTVEGVNDPPVASALAITATNNRIGTLNTATFTFTDPENDGEGDHIYQWYRSDYSNGLNAVAITGATSATYRPVKADGGKYIAFEVTPVDEFELAGTLVRMTTFRYINAAPVASNVRIFAPIIQSGQTIRGRFSYFDKEGDTRGNATYTWYRSSVAAPTPSSPGTVIPATDSTYLLKNADAEKYIWFKVKPVATAGSTPGDSVWSNVIGPIGEFTANITGNDTFCLGAVMPITLTITAGQAPYEARLHRSGTLAKDTVISNIPESPWIINVKVPGTYTLISLTDDGDDAADVSAATPVSLVINAKPRALISGTTSICAGIDTHAPLTLNFTAGTPPWNVTIRRRDNPPYNDTTISGIDESIYHFEARIIGTGPTRHRVIAITDHNGCAGDTTSGSAWLSYKTTPIATIAGSDSICPGESATISVTLTSGIPNWSFTYVRNGASPVTIAGISVPTRTFTVTQPGTYTLFDVKDATNQSGCGSGEAVIVNHTLPAAQISGSATICEHTSTNLSVALTGNAPWKFYYTRNLGDSVIVENVVSSPRIVPVTSGGNYTLYTVFDRNRCKGTVSGSALVTITQAPDVTISGLKQVYNRTLDDIDTIVGAPAGGVYAGPGVFGNYFIPALAPLGTHNITYAYRASPASCYGYDTAVVSVLQADAIINIENNRTKYCTNDAPFIVTGVNLFGVEGFFTITGGVGIESNGVNSALVTPSALQANRYTITYTYMNGGSIFPKDIEIEIGNPPEANFTWATECFNAEQPIDFTDMSTPSFGYFTDTSYYWKIYTHTGYDQDSLRNITYTFREEGRYFVELQVENSNGCRDTALALFNLRPTHKLNEVYYESFEENPISWDSGKEKTSVNSWRFEKPVRHGSPLHGFPNAHSGEKAWFTYINSYPAPNEKSWVTSPCFDFTGIERPMLTMWMWRLFNSNRDGANLKASVDSGKTWTLVGEIGDGINWYNSYGILGQPDGTPVGWSNDNGTSNDINWTKARHSLDFLKGEKEVQFRIFYGSAVSAQNNDGIAFDDFMISSRDKMALIEHFTNSNLEASAKADSILDAMVQAYGNNVVDLQYHTLSPAGDPFYEHNPSVLKARQYYYGLSAVPVAILDGGTDAKHLFDYDNLSRPLDRNAIIVESLEDNLFDIRLEASLNSNILNTEAQIWAKDDVAQTEMSVRIVVVERIIADVVGNNGDTIFRNVVKAMLPGGHGGITFNSAWTKGQDRRFEGTWELDNVFDVNQLRVVAFIQNEQTKEVYQVAYTDSIDFDVSIDPPVPGNHNKLNYYIFPNPVRQYATVQFSEAITEDITIQLFNNIGKLVYAGKLLKGTSSEQVPVENLPDGLYLLRLTNVHKLLGVSKVLISK